MAWLVRSDDRGAVYVEFLIAFFPMFLLFLGVCQLALVAAAEAVVRHSAFSAVRSAIVTLDDQNEQFKDVECGNLSAGNTKKVPGIEAIVEKLAERSKRSGAQSTRRAASNLGVRLGSSIGLGFGAAIEHVRDEMGATFQIFNRQHGARMVPIRAAALLPLLPLAPKPGGTRAQTDSVANALQVIDADQITSAIEYTASATAVTVHDTEGTAALALDAFEADALVTVRVRYVFRCGVPVVRMLMCRSLKDVLADERWHEQAQNRLSSLDGADARFKLLTATATLPNQGAHYYARQP